jgi:hypothetical protein
MDAAASPSAARLNGWKEIAAHFGRAVRTVQRWERDLGLPVHRLATGKGETVYAVVNEVDAWLAANERNAAIGPDLEGAAPSEPDPGPAPDAPDAPGPRWSLDRRRALLAAGLLVVVIAATSPVWMRGGIGGGNGRIPSTYRREGRVLTVLDQSGEVMWHRTMPFELAERRYATDPKLNSPVIFQDLDGDGRTEVLFKAIGARAADSALHVFEQNGQPRFSWTYRGTKRFGETPYPAPWAVRDVVLRRRASGPPEIWVLVVHLPWFPSALVRLDARGRMTGEFWHPGNLSTVAPARLGGRDVLLAGGANNEFKSAFLAVVDPDGSSTAPAGRDYYTCRDCPVTPSLRYVLFPRTTISRELDGQAFTREITQDSAGRLFVVVEHLGFPLPGESETMSALAFYMLDDHLRPLSAEVAGDYVQVSRKLERDGRLRRLLDKAAAEHELWPIREWNGSAFAPLPSPVGASPR